MSVAVPVIDYIDAINRRIYLLAGVTEYHPVTDIYHEVRNLRRTNEALRPYDPFVTAEGNVPKNVAGTKRTPRYAVFQNCKVVLSGDTLITGEQLLADATGAKIGSGPDCVDKALSPADAYCDYTPAEAEVIEVATGGGPTAQEIANAVWQTNVTTGGATAGSMGEVIAKKLLRFIKWFGLK
jgi:hypothetical protein